MNIMMKNIFLLISVSLLFSCAPKEKIKNKSGEKMNILFIAVDDLKPNLGCYGDTVSISPNIDKLAGEAAVFTNNHCQQAVCGPSRASLLTGLRPDRTEVWDLKTLIRDKNPDVVTLPQYFKENGYQTAARGKVFDLRSVDKKHDEISWTYPYESPNGRRWIGTKKKLITQNVDLPDDQFFDGSIVNQSMELLEKMSKKEKPFFLAVGFKKPHLPFVAPKKCWDKFDRNQFKLAEFQEHAKNAPEFAFQPGWELRGIYAGVPKTGRIPDDMQRELIHGYYACINHIDDQIGKLLNKLDELGLRENTIVVLWGDHGWHLGDHLMWCKHTNFEQSTRAPLIIFDPRIRKEIKYQFPTEFIDIFPTLCDLTGLKIPSDIDGVSLAKVLINPEVKVKKFAMSQFHRDTKGKKVEGYAIRTERYRYVEWVDIIVREDNGKYGEDKIIARELYDYQKDPLEKISVVDSPEYKEIAEKMHKQMKDFFLKKKK